MKTFQLVRAIPAWVFVPILLISFCTLSYCTEKQQRKTDNAVDEFKGYVNEQVNKVDSTSEERWEEIEKVYAEKKARAEAQADKLEAEARESYQKAVNDWEQYKQKAAARQDMRQAEKDAKLLKASLVPAGTNTDLSNVTGANIASVCQHFMDEVERNKETYSKEQWININNYWQSLNDVKDRLDKAKAISDQDNKIIRGVKARYSATKVLNKPFAEAEKNIN